MRKLAHSIGLALGMAAAAAAFAAAPKTVKATYNGYMNGMAIGVITEHFESDRGSYRILSETRPVGLAVFIQRQPLRFVSRGLMTREGLRPLHFEGRRNASDAPQVSADFDWSAGQLVLRHNGKSETLPLRGPTQDRLSIMYQFMFTPPENTLQVEFAMTNGRKLDQYRYRVTPEVELETPLGRVKTVHLVKQRDPGDTAAEVWLSPAHHYLAMRMLIVEKDGMRFEQHIQHVELRD